MRPIGDESLFARCRGGVVIKKTPASCLPPFRPLQAGPALRVWLMDGPAFLIAGTPLPPSPPPPETIP